MKNLQYNCGERRCVDETCLASIKENMLDEEVFLDIAETFQVLSEPTRVKIVHVLAEGGELCVHHIATILGMTSSAVSHQLRQLRNMRLVKTRKEAQHVYYSLNDGHIMQLFNQCLEHVQE
ncbi:ArsR/SmtB family transcription factor [Dendrosporobacter sp. 1207_IL3150]|uniref:ArsR/SmtB family transcription factor n=1 Tax=Dendrosporobacter sp. 1207_IL3150 TaxID=3084054 RepID=UPI002FDB3AEE